MTTLNKAQYENLAIKGLKSQDYKLTGFAEACYDNNTYEDLVTGLDADADAVDCEAWGISGKEWQESIRQALEVAMYWYEDENA